MSCIGDSHHKLSEELFHIRHGFPSGLWNLVTALLFSRNVSSEFHSFGMHKSVSPLSNPVECFHKRICL